MGKLSNLKHEYFVRNRIEWRKEKMVFWEKGTSAFKIITNISILIYLPTGPAGPRGYQGETGSQGK